MKSGRSDGSAPSRRSRRLETAGGEVPVVVPADPSHPPSVGLTPYLKDARFLLLVSQQGLPAAARCIGTSERTVQRAAASLGTSIRALLAEFHRKSAENLFRTGKSVGEVARILGYEHVASFGRFISREYGVSASALRHHLLHCPLLRDGRDPLGSPLSVSSIAHCGRKCCLWREMLS